MIQNHHQTPKPQAKKTRAQRKKPTPQLVISSPGLSNLSNATQPLPSESINFNLSSANIIPDSNMSQFPQLPNLETLNLNQLTGTSSELEETEEEKPKKVDRFTKMHDDLLEQFGGIGIMIYQMHQADGEVLLARADPLATKLTNVARQNPNVYKAIKKYLEGSVWTVLALEVATIANAIAVNHGVDAIGTLTSSIAGVFRGSDGDANVSAVA